MSLLTLRQLRAVAAIARTGRIAAAADALGVTAPAVTLQLKLAEEANGLALFERTRSGLKLTEAGRLVLDAALRVATLIADCEDGLKAIKGLTGGKVSVGVVSTAKYFAPRIIRAFMLDHPQIDLRLSVGNRTETIQALASFEIDLVVMGRPPADLEVHEAAFGPHPHVIIAPPDHPLAGKRRISTARLAAESLLVREEGSGTRALFRAYFAGHDVKIPPVQFEIGSNETVKQAVLAGLGLALISAHTVAAEVDSGRLVILDVAGLPIVREWRIVRRADRTPSPAAQALWDFVEAKGHGFLPQILGMKR